MPKWKWLIAIPVLSLACLPGLAPAATIDYYASGFFSQTQAYVQNSASESNDSGTISDWNADSVYTNPSASVSHVSAHTENSGQHGSWDENMRYAVVNGQVWGYSVDSGGIFQAYGEAHTVSPAVTSGIFFIINPSEGEHVGDPVTLSWEWFGEMQTSVGTTASLAGGYTEDMALTLNDYPTPLGPTPAKTIWSKAGVSLGEDDSYYDSDYGEHLAYIGDIIGVHLGAGAYADFTGEVEELNAYSFQGLFLNVETVPIPGAVWLLGSGLIGLAGLRRRLKS